MSISFLQSDSSLPKTVSTHLSIQNWMHYIYVKHNENYAVHEMDRLNADVEN